MRLKLHYTTRYDSRLVSHLLHFIIQNLEETRTTAETKLLIYAAIKKEDTVLEAKH
jgi:hypothetical protein